MIFGTNVPQLSVFYVAEADCQAFSRNVEILAKLATSRGDRREELPALLNYYVDHCVNIKNMLEYAPTYVESLATNEYFYVDTSRHPQEDKTNANYNKGFADRKVLLGTSSVVNTEIPLNRYSFFESLEDELLPNTKVELHVKIEDDGNVIWQAGANCRVIITRMQLIVPRVTFNSEGQELYMSTYFKPHKWTYLRENIERSNSSTQRAGNFRISNGISKPRHVFVFIINDASLATKQRILSSTTRFQSQQTHKP